MFELQRAVLCLIDHKFYGAAFALVRPIIETVVRAHVAIMGSEENLHKPHGGAGVGAGIDAWDVR